MKIAEMLVKAELPGQVKRTYAKQLADAVPRFRGRVPNFTHHDENNMLAMAHVIEEVAE